MPGVCTVTQKRFGDRRAPTQPDHNSLPGGLHYLPDAAPPQRQDSFSQRGPTSGALVKENDCWETLGYQLAHSSSGKSDAAALASYQRAGGYGISQAVGNGFQRFSAWGR